MYAMVKTDQKLNLHLDSANQVVLALENREK
jgi:hypothetical protein